tara:strand:+ start:23549 stop:24073 length:525 start_codon:yes stop_codon:yes gene_type:complete
MPLSIGIEGVIDLIRSYMQTNLQAQLTAIDSEAVAQGKQNLGLTAPVNNAYYVGGGDFSANRSFPYHTIIVLDAEEINPVSRTNGLSDAVITLWVACEEPRGNRERLFRRRSRFERATRYLFELDPTAGQTASNDPQIVQILPQSTIWSGQIADGKGPLYGTFLIPLLVRFLEN